MSVAFREWSFILVDSETGHSIDDDSGQLLVLTAGAPTAPTIYSDAVGTSVSNPVRTPRTFTNGRVKFWTARSVTSVDLVVMTAKGQAYFLEDVPYSRHRILVNEKDRHHILVVPFGASDATEVDTGMDLPANLLVTDALLRVTTVDATETIDFGILSSESGGDANGFMALASVATAGYVDLNAVVNDGTTSDYFNSSEYGVLIASLINGSDAAATSGGFVKKSYFTDGVAKSLTYTGSAGSDTAAGYFYVPYYRMP